MKPSTLNSKSAEKSLHKKGVSLLSAAVLLGIWWASAAWFFPDIILPSPLKVLLRLLDVMQLDSFRLSLAATVSRGIQAFAVTLFLGALVGIIAGYFRKMEAVFNPLLVVIKATPVMSFILLAFIWFETGTVPVFAAVLMSFPLITHNVMTGVREVDPELLQMAWVYRFSFQKRLRHIILPSIVPYFLSGGRAALGMCWKVVVAAEVLTVPKYGIGSNMQFAQMNLNTAEVLAWTIMAILLTSISGVLFNAAAYLMQPQNRRLKGWG